MQDQERKGYTGNLIRGVAKRHADQMTAAEALKSLPAWHSELDEDNANYEL